LKKKPAQNVYRSRAYVDHLAAELAVDPATMSDKVHGTQEDERDGKCDNEGYIVVQF